MKPSPPIDLLRPLVEAVTGTRMRDMALIGVAGAVGAWVAPIDTPVLGAVLAAACAAALRMAMPRGAWVQRAETLHASTRPSHPENTGQGDPILDRLPIPYLVLDSDARVTSCSTDARTLLARDPRGAHIATVFRAPAVLAAIDNALADGTDESLDFTAHRPRKRHIRATIRALQATDPADARVVLALQDVTQMRALDAMRMDFVANASHELRTPLAAITGMVETLQGPARDDPDNRDRFLGIIKRESARMARLIDDLLSLSRIELQENVAPTGREDLALIITEAIGATASLATRNDNTITVDLGEAVPLIRGDRDEILQVFHNLITNAIKYGGTGNPIEITRADDGTAQVGITVRDHGEGIEPNLVPRLTERFFRVNKRESVSQGGTGLGLAIVKHILTRHGGRLQIESESGDGSAFTVWLPVAEGAIGSGSIEER